MGENEKQAGIRSTPGRPTAEGRPSKDLNKKAFGGLLFLLQIRLRYRLARAHGAPPKAKRQSRRSGSRQLKIYYK
jgi:hypothetical protein